MTTFMRYRTPNKPQPVFAHTQLTPEAFFVSLYRRDTQNFIPTDPGLRCVMLCVSANPDRPFGKEALEQFRRSLMKCAGDISAFMTNSKKGKKQVRALLSRINKDMMGHVLYNRDGIPWGLDAVLLISYHDSLKVASMGAMGVYRRDLEGWYDMLENERYTDVIHNLDTLGSYHRPDCEFFDFEMDAQNRGDLIVCNPDGGSALEAVVLNPYYDEGKVALQSLPLKHQVYLQTFPAAYLVAIPAALLYPPLHYEA